MVEKCDDTPEEIAAAAKIARHAFGHEVECYGIDDGQRRRPLDPQYADWPDYRSGHAIGLTLPACIEESAGG